MGKSRSYSELLAIPSFEERFEYLKLNGTVAGVTFGNERYLNQKFYSSREWRSVRSHILVRDNGCDMGVPGRDIARAPSIHHINPITRSTLAHGDDLLLDPDNLITVGHLTHNAIHYGDVNLLPKAYAARELGDTKLW